MRAKLGICAAVISAVLVSGCRGPVESGEAGGSAGSSAGGSGGSSGSGGVGGMPTGGSGGGTGGTGIGGGAGGSGGLGLPGDWKPVRLDVHPAGFELYEADPATLELPRPEWESCGPGCESTTLAYGNVTGDVIVATVEAPTGGAMAIVGVKHALYLDGDPTLLQRVIRLSDGMTLGAFLKRAFGGAHPAIGVRAEMAASVFLYDGDSGAKSYASLELSEGATRWWFREPWDESRYRTLECDHFDLEGSPPAYLFACPHGVDVMLETGEATVLPDSANAVAGAGSRGLAVWAQHRLGREPGEWHRSRVRAWAPGEEVRDLVEVEGIVCGLGVGDEVVVGLLGDDHTGSGRCNTGLTNPHFFVLPRTGGMLERGPRPPVDSPSASIIVASVSGDFATVLLAGAPDMEYPDRWKIVLIRLSDWQMRVFPVPQGRSISTTGVAVDFEHLYFATKMNEPFKPQGFDRLYRYRLDHFDQIGEPAEAAAP